MILTSEIKTSILGYGLSNPTEELCGYISPKGDVIKCQNLAEDRTQAFVMDCPDDALAIWHTHTNESALLSFCDIEQARSQNIPYICCDPINNDWDIYDPNIPHPFPLRNLHKPKEIGYYLNRPFYWGRSDCYELARDYYRGMLDIEIGMVERKETLEQEWHPEWDRYNEELPGKGFEKLPTSAEIQLHDLVLLHGVHYPAAHHILICVSLDPLYFIHSEKPGCVSELVTLMSFERNLHGGSIWRFPGLAPQK